ncbi:hypothetical protein MKZ38_001254 [Zalerion maritima]|uniref:Major facilitator superfamily (MFS) profile domain-containing protein n=1 Tax=Zalerion maritima TaxID=339359 RepID=A0AAD5RF32_9PEZI|nr:hypothetical protein MKZ38_001254 [Zalerion maritima]
MTAPSAQQTRVPGGSETDPDIISPAPLPGSSPETHVYPAPDSSTAPQDQSHPPSSNPVLTTNDNSPSLTYSSAQYSLFTHVSRIQLTYILGIIITLSTLTTSIYFPLIPLLSQTFRVPIQSINLTVTLYAICQALSPVIFASLADSLGRRPILLFLILIYSLASAGLSLNQSFYPLLLFLRALQSVGGSPTLSIAFGIVADLADVSERGAMLGPMQSTCNGISAFGPVVGGAVALTTSGHRWVFLALLIVAIFCFVLAGFTIPETSRHIVGNGSLITSATPRFLYRTWRSLLVSLIPSSSNKKREGDEIFLKPMFRPQLQTQAQSPPPQKRPPFRPRTLVSPLLIIFHRDSFPILWTVASSYCVHYTYQVAIPVIFSEIYHYNELQIGLSFLPGLAGMTIGGFIAGKLVDWNFAKVARRHNQAALSLDQHEGKNNDTSSSPAEFLCEFPIEQARYKNYTPIILLLISLIASYGWAVQSRVHPAVLLVMQFFICCCSTILSHTASALLVDIFPDSSSTAYASGQVMRCSLSAASAAVIEPLVDKLGRGWYFTAFAIFTGTGLMGMVYTSKRKGMEWRRRRLARAAAAGR